MLYTGLLFGLPLAVTSFNRYSRLVEALCRRFSFCMASLYFDDAHVTDRKSCLAAIKDRQQARSSELTDELRHCFSLLTAVIQTRPQRELEISPFMGRRFLAASDAALEVPRSGTGGFLLVWHNQAEQLREAFVAVIPPRVYDLWEPGDKKIAQLELLQAALHPVVRAASGGSRSRSLCFAASKRILAKPLKHCMAWPTNLGGSDSRSALQKTAPSFHPIGAGRKRLGTAPGGRFLQGLTRFTLYIFSLPLGADVVTRSSRMPQLAEPKPSGTPSTSSGSFSLSTFDESEENSKSASVVFYFVFGLLFPFLGGFNFGILMAALGYGLSYGSIVNFAKKNETLKEYSSSIEDVGLAGVKAGERSRRNTSHVTVRSEGVQLCGGEGQCCAVRMCAMTKRRWQCIEI
eukprot:s2379_g11.t1